MKLNILKAKSTVYLKISWELLGSVGGECRGCDTGFHQIDPRTPKEQ